MANIIPTYPSQIDPEMFKKARAMDLPHFTELLPELHAKGLLLIGEEVALMQSRGWENGVLKALQSHSVYYQVFPDAARKAKLVSGLFTLHELEMFLHDEGPIIRGTPEQRALGVIFCPPNPERLS